MTADHPTLWEVPPGRPLAVSEAFTLDEFAAWAETVTWTPAKTVPDQPHWWWVTPSLSDPTFRSLWETIRTLGEYPPWPAPGSLLDGKVKARPYAYLTVGEWEYWRAPIRLLNRARPGRLN